MIESTLKLMDWLASIDPNLVYISHTLPQLELTTVFCTSMQCHRHATVSAPAAPGQALPALCNFWEIGPMAWFHYFKVIYFFLSDRHKLHSMSSL